MTSRGSNTAVSELIDQVRAGSTDAFAELFRRYAPLVHQVASRMLTAHGDADDVVQDVFLGLPRALRSYRGDGSLEGWIRRVAVRTCLMRLRSRTRRREEVLDHEVPGASHVAGSLIDRIALQRALDSLPEPHRVVFVLKTMEGYSHAEIAAMLEITEEASRARLGRARSKLRSLLF
jgi:RNA polymerase sigma-70 factor (ECF subfamily)